jgi:hypothetical protein
MCIETDAVAAEAAAHKHNNHRVTDPCALLCGHLYCNGCIGGAPQPFRCVYSWCRDQGPPFPLYVDFFGLVDEFLQHLTLKDQRIAQKIARVEQQITRVERLYQDHTRLQRRVHILRREIHLLREGQFHDPFDRLWVANAEFDGVNGEYEISGTINDSPCYIRRGTWERGAQVTFTIYRRPLTRRI